MSNDTDYIAGFRQAVAGHPLVSEIDASYSGQFITGWLDGRESAGAKPLKNEYAVSLTATFPFATMPVGGSFVVPHTIAINARGAATDCRSRSPETSGIRAWRARQCRRSARWVPAISASSRRRR